ncbi:MAG: hypothetical protein KJ787_14135 [Gammaproteobacteria bacterium]|nr:hypothetical protein [Gammaproteobacteria bacterium]MBU1647467.1 hypothetical protein [Gammaproteobacteria bacterium]MBU1972916.1 hypothetical protein [Gammaproteobacteria bacterium]
MIAQLSDRLRDWLHRRRHAERFALLEGLLRHQALSRAEVLRQQQDDLANIVAFAAANTDFYRDRLAPDRPFIDQPILTKDDVVHNRDAMLARGADRKQVGIAYTGGSTGNPLAYYWDAAKHELMRAGMMRAYMGSGWRPGDGIINFWGASQDIRGGGIARRYGEYVTGERTLGARDFDERKLGEWAACIGATRPVLLQGYASILAELARYVIDKRIAMPRSLRGIYSTAEVLTAEQREAMERAFSCRVFNQYGCREVPNIACECRHGNMHVFTDMVHLESLPQDGADRLIVTSLTNRLMPFIRYDLGDSGRLLPGDCDCGWPFPLMEMGMCRRNDLIRTSSGKVVYPAYFNSLLNGIGPIRQYQFVQTALDRMVLKLVSERPLDGVALEAMRQKVRRDVDGAMLIEVNYVDAIPRSASGKHRFIVAELPATD